MKRFVNNDTEDLENIQKFVNSIRGGIEDLEEGLDKGIEDIEENIEKFSNSTVENTVNFTSKVLSGAGLLLIPICIIAYAYTKC
jgi:predicted PurR-regulated permease PerM